MLTDHGGRDDLRQLCIQLTAIAADWDDAGCNDPSWTATWTQQHGPLTESFNRLDELIRRVDPQTAADLLADPQTRTALPRLRRLRSRYEGETERKEAQRILAAPSPRDAMVELLDADYSATTIHSATFAGEVRTKRRCLVIGSGPLPVTAALLLQNTSLALTCLDRDASSCALGGEIIAALGLGEIATEHGDALEIADFARWDVIMLTALADDRDSPSAEAGHSRLISHLAERCPRGTLLGLRTPHGLGELLYPVVDTAPLHEFAITFITSPQAGRSSMIMAQKTRPRVRVQGTA